MKRIEVEMLGMPMFGDVSNAVGILLLSSTVQNRILTEQPRLQRQFEVIVNKIYRSRLAGRMYAPPHPKEQVYDL